MCIRATALVGMRVTVSLACMVTASWPLLAHADHAGGASSAPQTSAEMAEARYRAGVGAYAKGHYRDAIELFLQANRLRPSAALSFNVARCYEHLDDTSSTLAWYRDYLRRSDRTSDDHQVARLIARLEKRLLEKGVQQLTVYSSPHGATVLIDRNPVGVAPWTGDLAPGGHSIELTLRGFEDLSQHFDLPRDHALDINLALEPKRAVEAVEEAQATAIADPPAALELQRVPAARTIVTAASEPERESMLTPLGWTLLGAGGASLGGALIFEVLRHAAEKEAQRETTQIKFAQDVDKMSSRQTVARVLGGIGATLAVAGGTLLVVGASENEHAPGTSVALSCAPARCRASLTGRF
jgi:tetratricopeptide (TPR) repeat protein